MEPTLTMQTCECCGQVVKLYRRTITNDMVTDLYVISNYYEGLTPLKWTELSIAQGNREGGGGSRAKLRYWGLVEKRGSKWFITGKGRRFLAGEIKVPKHCYVFNRRVYGFSDDTMSVDDARSFEFLAL